MREKETTYQQILDVVKNLQEEVTSLKNENEQLKSRIKELEHKKNSNNSSIPPSKDENRPIKNKSLRGKSGKSSGGQKGHKGHTLHMVSVADKTTNHYPNACKSCGSLLLPEDSSVVEKRQVIELPPIKPIFHEHRTFASVCQCGCLNKGQFPDKVKAPVQYGESVENMVAYLNVGQYIPYNRIASMFNGVFNLPLSEGSINNMIGRFAKKMNPFYEQIRQEIESSKIVGADETGAKVNGAKWWFWTWQNTKATYITATNNRAFDTVEQSFPNGFTEATLLSDRYGAQLKTKAKAHQICMAHLLRDLNYFIELSGTQIAAKLKGLIQMALDLKKKMTSEEFKKTHPLKNYIIRKTTSLLKADHSKEHKKFQAFLKRLLKARMYIFEFLYDEDLPPDNNASERAIRNVKVKQKVSTMFKSETGIKNYAIIRSIFDTCTKRNIPIIEAYKVC